MHLEAFCVRPAQCVAASPSGVGFPGYVGIPESTRGKLTPY